MRDTQKKNEIQVICVYTYTRTEGIECRLIKIRKNRKKIKDSTP